MCVIDRCVCECLLCVCAALAFVCMQHVRLCVGCVYAVPTCNAMHVCPCEFGLVCVCVTVCMSTMCVSVCAVRDTVLNFMLLADKDIPPPVSPRLSLEVVTVAGGYSSLPAAPMAEIHSGKSQINCLNLLLWDPDSFKPIFSYA